MKPEGGEALHTAVGAHCLPAGLRIAEWLEDDFLSLFHVNVVVVGTSIIPNLKM